MAPSNTRQAARLLLVQQCRGRHKWHSKKPRVKSLERRTFEAVSVPILPEMLKKKQPYCYIEERNKYFRSLPDEENLYEQFLIRQCKKMFENKMIICLHRLPIRAPDNRALNVLMKKNEFKIHYHNNEIMRKVVQNNKWANMESLLLDRNIYITSQEPRVKELLKILKKVSQHLVLMCGIVDNVILSKAGLERYADLPSMDILLGHTVSTLNMSAAKTKSLLSSHQEKLCANLSQYVNDHQNVSDADKPE